MNVYTNTYVILKILYSNIVLLMFLNQKINIIPTANIISFFQYFENIITHHFDLSLNYNLQHTILALLGWTAIFNWTKNEIYNFIEYIQVEYKIKNSSSVGRSTYFFLRTRSAKIIIDVNKLVLTTLNFNLT